MHSRERGKNCDPLEGCRTKGAIRARSGRENQGIMVPDPWGSATRLGSEPPLTHNPGPIDFTSKAGWIRQDLGAGKDYKRPMAWRAPRRGPRSSGSHLWDVFSPPDSESLEDPAPAPNSPWRIATILLSEHLERSCLLCLLLSSQSLQHLAIVSVQ